MGWAGPLVQAEVVTCGEKYVHQIGNIPRKFDGNGGMAEGRRGPVQPGQTQYMLGIHGQVKFPWLLMRCTATSRGRGVPGTFDQEDLALS